MSRICTYYMHYCTEAKSSVYMLDDFKSDRYKIDNKRRTSRGSGQGGLRYKLKPQIPTVDFHI